MAVIKPDSAVLCSASCLLRSGREADNLTNDHLKAAFMKYNNPLE